MIKTNKLKAQSVLEYSLLIVALVGALLIMQHYFGRGVEGLLKGHADNLGGERIGEKQYSPGKFYGANSTARISNRGLEYEGKRGFGITFGKLQRSQVSKLSGATNTAELAAQNSSYNEALTEGGEDIALLNSVAGSQIDPGIANVDSAINNNTPWSANSGGTNPQEGDLSSSVDSQALSAVNNNISQGEVGAALDEEAADNPQLAEALAKVKKAQENIENAVIPDNPVTGAAGGGNTGAAGVDPSLEDNGADDPANTEGLDTLAEIARQADAERQAREEAANNDNPDDDPVDDPNDPRIQEALDAIAKAQQSLESHQ